MSHATRGQRWTLSFADLCLLLLGFFVLLQARPDRVALADGLSHAFGAVDAAPLQRPARTLFEPGEAILRLPARRLLAGYARGAGGKRITIESRGTDPATTRLDGWELAAARAAAIARALAGSGVAPARIDLRVAPASGSGQMLILSAN